MKIDPDHAQNLIQEARETLQQPLEERLRFIQMERWIAYPKADYILERLETLINLPKKDRMPGMLIVGEPNNGKTSLVKRFCALHPKSDGWDEKPPYPVMYVQAPSGPDERQFYDSILSTLLVPFRYRDAPSEKLDSIDYYFNKIGTRILIVDEIHNILSGSVPKQRAFLNALKNLSNRMKIPLVLVGTKEALAAVSIDSQFSSRFRPERLSKWKPDKDFVSMLANMERTLPLVKPSNLATQELAPTIFELSGGILGELSSLLAGAASIAIKSGSDRISLKELKMTETLPPSERLRYATLDDG